MSLEERLEAIKAIDKPEWQEEDLNGERDKVKKSQDPVVVFEFATKLLAGEEEALQSEGIELIKKLSSKGLGWFFKRPLSDAQYVLGNAYLTGSYGLKLNQRKAYHNFLKAAKHHHAKATFQVGQCHELGIGCKKAPRRSVEYYRKAAVLGEDRAMHRLALILLFGQLGKERSLKEGMAWLKRAALMASESGNWAAMYDLGRCYEDCPVVIKDEGFALECYERAAEEGNHGPAKYRLGKACEFGQLGLNLSMEDAIYWYTKAANAGYGPAQMTLSYWTLKGIPSILKADPEAAFSWAKLAADSEKNPVDPVAIYQLARFYEEGVGQGGMDLEEACKLYGQAAALGHSKAKTKLKTLQQKTQKASHCMIQ